MASGDAEINLNSPSVVQHRTDLAVKHNFLKRGRERQLVGAAERRAESDYWDPMAVLVPVLCQLRLELSVQVRTHVVMGAMTEGNLTP